MQAKIVAPAGAAFEAASAKPSTPNEHQNAGIHKLIVRLPEKTKQARIAIVIETNKGNTKPLKAEPLAEWISTAKK